MGKYFRRYVANAKISPICCVSAFKINYSFEGNIKSRPEQNLAGASKKLTRDLLLQKTQEERRKRQVYITINSV